MEKTFRSIVALSFLCFLSLTVLPYIDSYWLSSDEVSILNANGFGGTTLAAHPQVYWSRVVIWHIIFIELFFFIPGARSLYLAFYVADTIFGLFTGMVIHTALGNTVATIMTLADGAIFYMLFMTSVGKKFARTGSQ